MASESGGEYGCGLEFWEEQDQEFKGEFPVLHKRDFRSMREVRSYAPNKPVLWPTCSHGERCVMQVYEGGGNYGRRFRHCPLARVSYGNDICSSTMLGLLTFLGVLFNSPTMMTTVASRAMGRSPSYWPLSGLHQLHPWHRYLQHEAALGRSTCFPRSSQWQPSEDERLVPTFFTSTTTTRVLHASSAVLRRQLLALWPVLVQLVYDRVYKFPKAC
jgi:hypothetical protein